MTFWNKSTLCSYSEYLIRRKAFNMPIYLTACMQSFDMFVMIVCVMEA